MIDAQALAVLKPRFERDARASLKAQGRLLWATPTEVKNRAIDIARKLLARTACESEIRRLWDTI